MRPIAAFPHLLCALSAAALTALAEPTTTPPAPSDRKNEQVLQTLYTEALVHGQAYDNLRTLVTDYPGRLAGSKALEGAVTWGSDTLTKLQLDRVYTQDVMVPHWERGEPESAFLLDSNGGYPLSATALGGCVATPKNGVMAEVIEVHSIDELAVIGNAKIQGKIVFFNRPMDPASVKPGAAYGGAGDQRFRGPAMASRFGAAAALVRSLTQAHDDIPHTGVTVFPPGVTKIPALALSANAADKLSAALAAAKSSGSTVRVGLKVNAQWFPDAPSHNVIGEIRGTEFPDQIIVVGGHLDSWDITPGAHDDGAGIVQSIEVLRLFRAAGLKPKHTIRCVLFVNEENGGAGATAYASAAKGSTEKHIFAVETDAGGFDPRGFRLGSTQGDAAAKASRWLPLFQPYGLDEFRKGSAGADVAPLLVQGTTVAELYSDSQRYFDIHHTRADTLDKVNPRELELGAAALASLIYLVDSEGL